MFRLRPEQKGRSVNTAFHNTAPGMQDTHPGKMQVGYAAAVVCDVGCVRPNNEDNYVLGKYINVNSSDHSQASLFSSDLPGMWQLAGVFDGMGGGEMGELASRDTAAVFLDALNPLMGSSSKEDVDFCIRKAFLKANNQIVILQKTCRIFGTTGTVLCTNGSVFKIYHLGDSRAYLVRENELLQLTVDQTLAQMKLEMGIYQADAPTADADRHKLTEYIGHDPTGENIQPVESLWISLQAGDNVLLCSDGLYDMCTSEKMAKILCGSSTVLQKATTLVQEAISAGGTDNITCAVLSFP